jgi:hypothetical protein
MLGLAVAPAHGQGIRLRTLPVYAPGVNPTAPFYNRVSPLTYVAPGVTSQQALYNYFQAARAASMLPPWWYGYNPYPSPIYSPGPYTWGYGSYYNPYLSPYANPYLGYSSSMFYPPAAYGNPYAYYPSPSFAY